jgi:hypothetical protein
MNLLQSYIPRIVKPHPQPLSDREGRKADECSPLYRRGAGGEVLRFTMSSTYLQFVLIKNLLYF